MFINYSPLYTGILLYIMLFACRVLTLRNPDYYFEISLENIFGMLPTYFAKCKHMQAASGVFFRKQWELYYRDVKHPTPQINRALQDILLYILGLQHLKTTYFDSTALVIYCGFISELMCSMITIRRHTCILITKKASYCWLSCRLYVACCT